MSDDPNMIWDHVSCCERTAPSAPEIAATELEAARLLGALGGMQGIASAAEIIAALIYAEDFTPGGKAQTKYLILIAKFIARRVAQLERADALLPADIRSGGVH